MIVYLTKTPGDPWVMLQKAELERNRGNYDDAKLWAEKAGYFLSKNDQQEARNNLAETARQERFAQSTEVYAVKASNYKGLRRGSPV